MIFFSSKVYVFLLCSHWKSNTVRKYFLLLYFRKHTWVRARKVSVYTGSRDTPLVSAACWIWCSHFRLAQFLRPSVWLLSNALIRNSTTLSRTWSSLPLSSDTTNSMYLWNCFEDNLTSWPGWDFGNWMCSLAKRRKWETENGLKFINLRGTWSPPMYVLWISEYIKGISEHWDWLPVWIQYDFYTGYVCVLILPPARCIPRAYCNSSWLLVFQILSFCS